MTGIRGAPARSAGSDGRSPWRSRWSAACSSARRCRKLDRMTVSEQELTSLAATHDIISLGMLADDFRRQRHALNTTFVRVSDVPVDTAAPMAISAGAGEVRIVGAPATRAAAVDRVREVMAQAQGRVVSA